MGDFSMTCSLSGLGIPGGTPVRCLLLTASPYGSEDPRSSWIVRTPPLRAIYNSYGTIEQVHADDKFIAELWLRGLREDLVERGLGDNSVHDLPTAKDMSFEELLDAVRAGRVVVRQDARYFWRRPRTNDVLDIDTVDDARVSSVPSLRTIEHVLAKDTALVESYPDPVSRGAAENKFVVDEPVPYLVRVRFGRYQHGPAHLDALNVALAAIVRAGFVGVVAAGSGRYADDADLLVLPAPNSKENVPGPQWDMARGQSADTDKHLAVAMAMIREDVWQALSHYPHSDTVAIDCTNCGQESWYHEKDRRCPSKSINKKPFKKHPRGARYAHGPVFPDGVEHVVVPRDYGETVWYDLAAYRHGTRATWAAILDHFSGSPKSKKADDADSESMLSDDFWKHVEDSMKKEAARVAKLPVEERAKLEADRAARTAAWEAEERDRKEHPRFGDFLIDDLVVRDPRRPGAWLFRDSVPGVIGVSEHLSMCLADKLEVPLTVLDTIAELSAVRHVIHGVGVTWRPAASTGPQYPEWDQHLRFLRTLLKITESENRDHADEDADKSYATLAEVQQESTP